MLKIDQSKIFKMYCIKVNKENFKKSIQAIDNTITKFRNTLSGNKNCVLKK
jgi:hypothetical protein